MFCAQQKLLERGQEKDRILLEVKSGEAPPPQVLELRQTIQVLQEQLNEREGENVTVSKQKTRLEQNHIHSYLTYVLCVCSRAEQEKQ